MAGLGITKLPFFLANQVMSAFAHLTTSPDAEPVDEKGEELPPAEPSNEVSQELRLRLAYEHAQARARLNAPEPATAGPGAGAGAAPEMIDDEEYQEALKELGMDSTEPHEDADYTDDLGDLDDLELPEIPVEDDGIPESTPAPSTTLVLRRIQELSTPQEEPQTRVPHPSPHAAAGKVADLIKKHEAVKPEQPQPGPKAASPAKKTTWAHIEAKKPQHLTVPKAATAPRAASPARGPTAARPSPAPKAPSPAKPWRGGGVASRAPSPTRGPAAARPSPAPRAPSPVRGPAARSVAAAVVDKAMKQAQSRAAAGAPIAAAHKPAAVAAAAGAGAGPLPNDIDFSHPKYAIRNLPGYVQDFDTWEETIEATISQLLDPPYCDLAQTLQSGRRPTVLIDSEGNLCIKFPNDPAFAERLFIALGIKSSLAWEMNLEDSKIIFYEPKDYIQFLAIVCKIPPDGIAAFIDRWADRLKNAGTIRDGEPIHKYLLRKVLESFPRD